MRGALTAIAALTACGTSPTGPGREVSATLQLVAGGSQSQVAGYVLDDTVVVRLVDAADQAIPFAIIDASVDATDESPFATVTSVDARTREDGTARFVWRLGVAIGNQTLRVTSGYAPSISPLLVTATGSSNRLRALGGSDAGLCALDLTGQLGCWLPIADPDHPPRFLPLPTALRFTDLALYRLATGVHRGCALAETARVWCFTVAGEVVTDLAELGGSYPAFLDLATGSGDLAANPPFCARTVDGAAWCWGGNATGVLGDGSTIDRTVPTPVATAVTFTKLAVGSHHACGLSATGSIWCWGGNESAQIGLPPGGSPITTPRRIVELITFSDVAVVTDHAVCGVGIGGGGAWCWGRKVDLGVGALVIASIEGPATPRAIFVSNLVSPLAVGRIDGAVVTVGPPGNAAWWGDLSADVDLVTSVEPRPFVKSLGLRSLAMPASSGVVCGAAGGSDDQFLCGRVAALAGYRSHQPNPQFAGFGMPLP